MRSVPDAIMSDQKFLELCRRIASETDPKKMTEAIDEMYSLLHEEQDVIKAKIAFSLSRASKAPE